MPRPRGRPKQRLALRAAWPLRAGLTLALAWHPLPRLVASGSQSVSGVRDLGVGGLEIRDLEVRPYSEPNHAAIRPNEPDRW